MNKNLKRDNISSNLRFRSRSKSGVRLSLAQPGLIAGLLISGGAGLVQAAGPVADESSRRGGLHVIDWGIIAAYALLTIGLGAWFGRKQKTTQEYFVGNGDMSWLLIGVSLFATLLSSITYLSTPGEIIGKGPADLIKLLGLPIVFLIVGFGIIPVYMKHRVTSAYELLEDKLGISVRLLGVVMFLALRLVWMSLLIYMASKAMTVMMSVDEKWVPAIVLVTGLVSITYTSLGGMRAVVITDLVQTILLLGGAMLVLIVISVKSGGLDWFPTTWHSHWDVQPMVSFDPKTRITMLGSLLSLGIWYICTAGGDQVSVQRFMATRDAAAARRSFATQLTISAMVTLTLGLVGLALLDYYQSHPEFLTDGYTLRKDADKIFPLFIADRLVPGVSGLVVAAMFAAAMSSIDSGVNSITAVVVTDFRDRFTKRPRTNKEDLRFARLLAFTIGAIVVVGSMYMDKIPGNFFAMTNKTVNLLVPTIFCLFFFAFFVPFANAPGVWIGWFFGVTTAVLIAFSGMFFGTDPITGYDPISFQWIGPASLLADLGTGTLACWIFDRRKRSKSHAMEP